jgi:hypothetical protein
LKRALGVLAVERVVLEDVPRDDHEVGVGVLRDRGDALDDLEARAAHPGARVPRDVPRAHPELPVRGVNEACAGVHGLSQDASRV